MDIKNIDNCLKHPDLEALQKGEIELIGQFTYASNYTYLSAIHFNESTFHAVYKPVQGERPLWDFPHGSLARREAAAFVISNALKWNLVPATVHIDNGPYGAGSLQIFIEHDPEAQRYPFSPGDSEGLKRIVVFDVLINNADRKFGHIIRDRTNKLWCIDHGICFHAESKLRTVIWDFMGQKIPENLQQDVEQLVQMIQQGEGLYDCLLEMIEIDEIQALIKRGDDLVRLGIFPSADEQRPNVPWPPV